MRQGVGCPLTIVEEHAKRGGSFLMMSILCEPTARSKKTTSITLALYGGLSSR
jgi:hypothetical protein